MELKGPVGRWSQGPLQGISLDFSFVKVAALIANVRGLQAEWEGRRLTCLIGPCQASVRAVFQRANASFVEAPNSLAEMAEIGRRAPGPVVANMIEKGKTPVLPKEKLAELGFHLILYPLAGMFAAAAAVSIATSRVSTP